MAGEPSLSFTVPVIVPEGLRRDDTIGGGG